MFFNSGLFWFGMGVVFVSVAAGFKVFAEDRGWRLSWWKGALAVVWYLMLGGSFYAWGTLMGEGEASAGFKLLLLGLFVCVVFGVALLRLLAHKPRASA